MVATFTLTLASYSMRTSRLPLLLSDFHWGERPRTPPKPLLLRPKPVQHRKPQIRKRYPHMLLLGTDNMTLMFQAATGKQHGKVSVAVDRPVAHPAAEHDQRVVKNLGFFQLGNEVTELGGQEAIDDLELTDSIF